MIINAELYIIICEHYRRINLLVQTIVKNDN